LIGSWLLLAVLLTGCASNRPHAPIREAGKATSTKSNREVAKAPAGFYRIQPGDTLYKIAFQHHLDISELVDSNHLADPAHIRAGELLRITPNQNAALAVRPGPGDSAAVRAMPAEPTLPPAAGDSGPDAWSWPCRGELLAHYGDGSKGLDIGGVIHQPIFSAATGTVVYAGSGLRGYGKLIIIRHGKILLTAYAHNARILVSEGQAVRRGQQVGEMGDTDAERVKLHFEIREHGKPVDPLNYLPKTS